MKFLDRIFKTNQEGSNQEEPKFGNPIDAYKKFIPEELRGGNKDIVEIFRSIRDHARKRAELNLEGKKVSDANILLGAQDRFVEENYEQLATAV